MLAAKLAGVIELGGREPMGLSVNSSWMRASAAYVLNRTALMSTESLPCVLLGSGTEYVRCSPARRVPLFVELEPPSGVTLVEFADWLPFAGMVAGGELPVAA